MSGADVVVDAGEHTYLTENLQWATRVIICYNLQVFKRILHVTGIRDRL